SGEGAYIAAGGYNTASGEGAVVDGGFNQTASGGFATIPGGYKNAAAGTYSFAAGSYGSAQQTGTFVWSDGSNGNTPLTSTKAYQFLARAAGGFTLYTNAGATVGAQLAAGSGTWSSASDRNLKTDVVRIDDAAVLDKVAALPIERWSYKSERGVRHVGPMAQDFYAAFGVGEDDKHITSIDEDGVALAAIKALHAENARLRAKLASTDARLAKLSAAVAAMTSR
ncbi:MAG TPA: tail fiber domain-containing protein, partial [Candidatus Elarobacter sp.]|nr:tail fiber domain-containing protein [Candidatus Elarobacter sp.]